MMIQGFPVPDFDCFEDEDDDSCVNNCSLHQSSANELTEDDYQALCEKKGLIIDTVTPIKMTANSTVFAAKSPIDGKMFAIKITEHKRRIQSEFIKRNQIRDSPYLLKSISLHESPAKAMLQMEFCENGDIKDLIMPESYIWKLIHDIGSALKELHIEGWMHLDVSPGNILVSKNCFKLSDFGTLAKVGEFEEGMEGAGPYVSPEALTYPHNENGCLVNQQTDIFSFGVVLLEVASGKPAPRGGTKGYSMIRNEEVYLGCKDYECWCSPELVSLINIMLSTDPTKRPTSVQLCQIPRVKQFL